MSQLIQPVIIPGAGGSVSGAGAGSGGSACGFVSVSEDPILFSGALVKLSADIVAQNASTGTGTDASPALAWGSASYDTLWQSLYKFWLGPDLAFTAANATNRLTATAHATITGDGSLRITNSGGALPTGLAIDTSYWVIRIDDDTIQLATSFANAIATTAVTFSDDGTGTHTLVRASRLVVPGAIGSILKVRLYGAAGIVGSFSGSYGVQFRDTDGDLFLGSGTSGGAAGFNNVSGSLVSPPLLSTVAAAYIFRHAASDTDYDIESDTSHFAIEVVDES